MKSLFLALCAVLVLALSAGAMPKQGRFTQEEVVDIFESAGRKLGRPGVLVSNADLTRHSNFKLEWQEHSLACTEFTRKVSLAKARSISATFIVYIVYQFIDRDLDGILEDCFKEVFAVTREGTVVELYSESPERSLPKLLIEWGTDIPNAQELYERELAYWYYRLIHQDEEMN